MEQEDYEMLRVITYGSPTQVIFLPNYLRVALIEDQIDRDLPDIDFYQMLRYIKYEDFCNLVLFIYEESLRSHAVWGRHYFIEELTGVQYDDQGFPLREEDGDLIYLESLPRWMADAHIVDHIQIPALINHLSMGFLNKDPRIRILCVRILREMGPLPILYDRVRIAGGLTMEGLETVGNAEFGWYSTDPMVLTRRHCYCDLDGVHKEAVPFVQFAQYEMDILRFQLVKGIEYDQTITPDDFRQFSPEEYFTLIDPATVLGYYGVDRVTDYLYNAERDVNFGFYPIQPREYTVPQGQEFIPKHRWERKMSSFKYIARKILYNPQLKLRPQFLFDAVLPTEELTRIIHLLFGALDNRNYSVRLSAANLLYEFYQSALTTEDQKARILGETLYSRVLREIMKEEYIQEKEKHTQNFLDNRIFDNVRGDILDSDQQRMQRLYQRYQYEESSE